MIYEYKIDRGSYAGQRRKELGLVMSHIKTGTRPLIPDVPGHTQPTPQLCESYLPYLMTSQSRRRAVYLRAMPGKQMPGYRMYETGSHTNQAYMAVGGRELHFHQRPPCLRGIDTRLRDNRLNF